MTAIYDIDELLPDVRTFAAYSSDPITFRFIREASRELCDRVSVWYDTDTIELQESHCEGICTILDADIVSITRADLDGRQLEPKTVAWLDDFLPDWNDTTGVARYVTQLTPDTVTVSPQQTGTLKMRLVMKPSLDAETLPRVLATNFRTTIAKGAAGRLLMSPQVDTANPSLGQALYAEFQNELDRLSTKAAKTQFGASLRTRGHYF